jgi:hypothetical protein
VNPLLALGMLSMLEPELAPPEPRPHTLRQRDFVHCTRRHKRKQRDRVCQMCGVDIPSKG